MKILILAGYWILVTILGLLYMGIARKVTARIHNRYGPPFYQAFLDVLKLFSKRETASHGVMHSLGPVIAFAGISATLLFMPLGKGAPVLHFQGDLFVVLYLLVVGPLGMALGAGESNNPNATIGIARALSLMLGYEIILFMATLPVFVHYGTASIYDVIVKQGAFPNWAGLKYPLSMLGGLIALHGLLGEKPFDQPIAPHEIASGPMVEYGGKYLGLLQLWHAIGIIVETGLFINVFFGPQNIVWFFAGTFIVFMLAVIVNALMPRFRIEQAVRFYWGVPLILVVLGILQYYFWR
uniref:NADH-quinone oxidoreductase subunit H n=1 Tax=candidate division WOR-3 bacterium TaxID=2052148 RepID=A0A7C2PE10_UNCW3